MSQEQLKVVSGSSKSDSDCPVKSKPDAGVIENIEVDGKKLDVVLNRETGPDHEKFKFDFLGNTYEGENYFVDICHYFYDGEKTIHCGTYDVEIGLQSRSNADPQIVISRDIEKTVKDLYELKIVFEILYDKEIYDIVVDQEPYHVYEDLINYIFDYSVEYLIGNFK